MIGWLVAGYCYCLRDPNLAFSDARINFEENYCIYNVSDMG